MTLTLQFKQKLYNECLKITHQRISDIKSAVADARESGNSETKSSAGDKHETARAQAQLEQEKLSKQLADAQNQLEQLKKINADSKQDKIRLGSIVNSSFGNFYIAVSIGKITIDNQTYMAISPVSPLAIALLELVVNDEKVFNGIKITIKEVI